MASSMPSMSINALNTVRIRSTIMPVPHCPRGRAIPRDREDARRRARGVLRRENRQIRAESSLRAPTGDAEGRRRCRLSRVSIRFGPRSLVRVDSGLLGIDPASPAHRQRGGKGPRARGQPTARTRWRLRARRSSRGMWSADWDVRPQSPRPPRTHPATRRHPHRDSPAAGARLADTQTATRRHPDRDSPGGRHLGERLRRVPQAAASPARVHAPWPVPRPASPVVAR